MVTFDRRLLALVLVAVLGGIALFVAEALALQSVALDPWFPTGYVGDAFAWLLLVLDISVIGYGAYRFGLSRPRQHPDGGDGQGR